MSAVSKNVMPASSAAWTTAALAGSSMRRPKLLQPSPTIDTSSEPMRRFSMSLPPDCGNVRLSEHLPCRKMAPHRGFGPDGPQSGRRRERTAMAERACGPAGVPTFLALGLSDGAYHPWHRFQNRTETLMSIRLALCAGALLALTLAVASQASGWKHSSSSRSYSRSTRSTGSIHAHSTVILDEPSVMPGKRLDIDLATGGGIHIEGVTANEVSVDYSRAEDKCPDAEDEVNKTETGVSVRSRSQTERNTHYCSLEIMIRVPRRYDIHIQSSGGAIEIANVEGTIEGRTGGGELYLSRLT